MPHSVQYVLPGAGDDIAGRLERALTRAGRSVLARRPLEGPEPYPQPEPGTLRWQVRRLPADLVFDEDFNVLNADEPDPAFLIVRETLPGGERWSDEGWDLTLCRELSAEADGFVCALDNWDYICRHGVAMFLAGRTVEARERTVYDALSLGGPRPDDWWLSVWDIHGRHTMQLLDESACWLFGQVAHTEDWIVTPAGPFRAEPPSPTCRVVLPGLAGVPAGPRPPGLRVRTGRLDCAPFTVLGHEGRLEDLDLAALSAGTSQPVVGLEVPGGGEPFTWAHARGGEITATGRGRGAEDLLAAVRPLGDAPGLFFGG